MHALIYSKPDCPNCDLAKKFLSMANVTFEEVIVGVGITKEELLEILPNVRSVPQIFINGTYVGGYVEMVGYWKAIKEHAGLPVGGSQLLVEGE